MAGTVSHPLSGARAVPGDRRGLLDRKLQDRRLQSGPGHRRVVRWPRGRRLRACACFQHDQILPVSAVSVRRRLFRRSAIRAGDEARRAEAGAARRRRVPHRPCGRNRRGQDTRARSRLCGRADVGVAQPKRGDGDGDRRGQRPRRARGAARPLYLAHRGSRCGLLHLWLCRRDHVVHGGRTGTPEDRPAGRGAQARAVAGDEPRQARSGIRVAKVRAARLSPRRALSPHRIDSCGRRGSPGASPVHPSDPPWRTRTPSGARHHPRARRRHHDIGAAPDHRGADRLPRRGGRRQGTARHSLDLR
ncbi:hypothetical protein ACVJA9_004809 [Bradyrhizobium diazoefficiens]